MNIFTELGRFLLMITGMFSKPENMKMYWKEFMHQCVEIGIRSLGIVVIISVFMGAVSHTTALQTAYQLVSPLIPLSTIAQIVRDTVILEFSPTLVCIVLAGVVGSKIAGELRKHAGQRTDRCTRNHGYQYQNLSGSSKNTGGPAYHSYAGDYFCRFGHSGRKTGSGSHGHRIGFTI